MLAMKPRHWLQVLNVTHSSLTHTGPEARRLVESAMDHWMNYTCIKFVERTTEKDYILFVESIG